MIFILRSNINPYYTGNEDMHIKFQERNSTFLFEDIEEKEYYNSIGKHYLGSITVVTYDEIYVRKNIIREGVTSIFFFDKNSSKSHAHVLLKKEIFETFIRDLISGKSDRNYDTIFFEY